MHTCEALASSRWEGTTGQGKVAIMIILLSMLPLL
eukprot:COSAG06_NODE_6217_length_3044_cov_23.832008_1_plen_34_part_10